MQRACNRDDSLLMTSAMFKCLVSSTLVGKFFIVDCSQGTLHENWFNIAASSRNLRRFFFLALRSLEGANPAQEHKCLDEGKNDMSALISCRITKADRWLFPGTDSIMVRGEVKGAAMRSAVFSSWLTNRVRCSMWVWQTEVFCDWMVSIVPFRLSEIYSAFFFIEPCRNGRTSKALSLGCCNR